MVLTKKKWDKPGTIGGTSEDHLKEVQLKVKNSWSIKEIKQAVVVDFFGKICHVTTSRCSKCCSPAFPYESGRLWQSSTLAEVQWWPLLGWKCNTLPYLYLIFTSRFRYLLHACCTQRYRVNLWFWPKTLQTKLRLEDPQVLQTCHFVRRVGESGAFSSLTDSERLRGFWFQGFMIAIMSRILWNPSSSKVVVFFFWFLALSEKVWGFIISCSI